jgi:hypothetical protein
MIIPKEDIEFYFLSVPIKTDYYFDKDIGMVLLDDILNYMDFEDLRQKRSTRYYSHIYIDGKIDILRFGRTIYDLINGNDKISNKFKLRYTLKHGYPCFEESYFTEETCKDTIESLPKEDINELISINHWTKNDKFLEKFKGNIKKHKVYQRKTKLEFLTKKDKKEEIQDILLNFQNDNDVDIATQKLLEL